MTTTNDMFKSMNRAHDEKAAFNLAQSTASFTAAVTEEFAATAARSAGLEGNAAYYFRAGFEGGSLKQYNPRKEGFEAEFRAGQAAAKAAQTKIAAEVRARMA